VAVWRRHVGERLERAGLEGSRRRCSHRCGTRARPHDDAERAVGGGNEVKGHQRGVGPVDLAVPHGPLALERSGPLASPRALDSLGKHLGIYENRTDHEIVITNPRSDP
jgi:hypothetical protein